MKLTLDQKITLAQRIADEISGFVFDEYKFQVEAMKDNDELEWGYDPNGEDGEDIRKMVIDLITVPVQ